MPDIQLIREENVQYAEEQSCIHVQGVREAEKNSDLSCSNQ